PGEEAKWVEQNSAMQRPYNDDRVFSSAGAGLWTTVRDQLKFYKMLMNLGIGENGVRILKEETVKSILAVSTRPAGLGGYSLGLSAPETDNEDAWFGHGGAWSTNCSVNWHKRQLKLIAVQFVGAPGKFTPAYHEGASKFFKGQSEKNTDEYTGRMQ
ncbi:MAG: serine hydrolase, partial [Victivallales bacterium]|nr:serine hydrolase [Victivallales bacterium]